MDHSVAVDGRTIAQMMGERIDSANLMTTRGQRRPGYRLLTTEEVLNETPATRWLIKDFIEEGSTVVLFGESESMKSFAALSMALSIATGLDWYGNRVSNPGPVIYIAGEGSLGLKKRMQAWMLDNQILDPMSVPCLVGPGPIDLLDIQAVEELFGAYEELEQELGPPRMIIIDTLNRCFGAGGDENSTSDMTGFVASLDKLKTRWGCATFVVHHTGQGDKTRARGSSVLRCAVDFEFRLAVSGDTRVLTCMKAKEHEHPAPIRFAYDRVGTGMLDEDGHEIVKSP